MSSASACAYSSASPSTNHYHADLDNFVKPILDAMGKQGVFGPTLTPGSTMTGDERVDHLELARERVDSPEHTGVFIEVRALRPGRALTRARF